MKPKKYWPTIWVFVSKIIKKLFRFEIDFVKVSDAEEAKEYGIDTLPAVLYFENKIPSVYDEDLNNENELLEWLVKQLEQLK